jgi:hypothetical protein
LNERREQPVGRKAESFWRHLPQRFQAKLKSYGFVSFENMLLIDEKGDPEYAIPHLFIDFSETGGPFLWRSGSLHQKHEEQIHADEFETQYKNLTNWD